MYFTYFVHFMYLTTHFLIKLISMNKTKISNLAHTTFLIITP